MKKEDAIITTIMHVLFIIIFSVAGYSLYRLCTYGNIILYVPILGACFLFFMGYVVWAVTWKASHKKLFSYNFLIIPYAILLLFIGSASLFASLCSLSDERGIFVNYLKERQHLKDITIFNENIFKNGIDGMITCVDQKVNLPDELYVEDGVFVEFSSKGDIIRFETILYGQDQHGNNKKYTLSYNREESIKLWITIDDAKGLSKMEEKKLQPCIDMIKLLNIKSEISAWNEEDTFAIQYRGKRNLDFSSMDIYNLYEDGTCEKAADPNKRLEDYTISLNVVGKENEISAKHYVCSEKKAETKEPEQTPETTTDSTKNRVSDECMLSDHKTRYRLVMEDAALGTYYYSLYKSIDGGKTYKILNADPFFGEGGKSNGMTFINKKIGFLCLADAGGNKGTLYRTEDGGDTYKKVVLQSNGNEKVYDLPMMPEESNGILTMKVSQGTDGDYNGGSMGEFESKDHGKTWSFVKDMKE